MHDVVLFHMHIRQDCKLRHILSLWEALSADLARQLYLGGEVIVDRQNVPRFSAWNIEKLGVVWLARLGTSLSQHDNLHCYTLNSVRCYTHNYLKNSVY